MPGSLLIAWKNGRSVKTYGVNQPKIYNMKFTFICIVIVVACSVSASGDLEIYPDLKFNLNSEERSRLENYDDPDSFPEYKGHSWKNIPFNDYGEVEQKEPPVYDFTLPERLRQFEEVIDWEKAHLNRHGNRHHLQYESPKHRYDFEDVFKQFKDSRKPNFRNFGLGIPNPPNLDDVRMYPQEEDFSFNNDDVDEQDSIRKFYEQPSLGERVRERIFQENNRISLNDIRSTGDKDLGLIKSGHHQDHDHDSVKLPDKDTFPSGLFKDVKIVDDPTEFAYAPPDPRFYEKTEILSKIDADKTSNKVAGVGSSVNGKLKLKPRSDEKTMNYDDDQSHDFIYKGGDRESAARNGGVDVIAVKPNLSDVDSAGVYIIAIVAGISAAATVGLIAVGIGWYNLQKHVKSASDVEYPAYGVTGPNKDISPSGDRRLAQSAQMYHYQHQKQQIIAMERAPPGDRNGSVSDADSDEENEEGDYTVYECPGLAPTGEMEVKNPLFQDDPTPAQTPAVKPKEEEEEK